MPDLRTLRAMVAKLEAADREVGELLAKLRGGEPSAPATAQEARGLGSGSRAYRVSDWRSTCSGCPRRGRCSDDKRECGQARWFPLVHYVTLTSRAGVVVGSTCCDGRKAGGPPCSEPKCKHVDRALAVAGGKEDKGVELVIVSGEHDTMPKCPNCRERWSVSRVGDSHECRNPTCARDGRPWRFSVGDASRPSPMRRTLSILEREPGKVVVKRPQDQGTRRVPPRRRR